MQTDQLEQFVENYFAALQFLQVADTTIQRIKDEMKMLSVKSRANILLPGDIKISI